MKMTPEALDRARDSSKWAEKYLQKRRIGKSSIAVGILILPDIIDQLLVHSAALEADCKRKNDLLREALNRNIELSISEGCEAFGFEFCDLIRAEVER